MRILIIGLGYAGTRFLKAFGQARRGGDRVEIAYVDRLARDVPNRRWPSVSGALEQFRPQIVVISVNDDQHAGIIAELVGFRGFVIGEKPLVGMTDDLDQVAAALSQVSGFCLDLIERYSDVTVRLKQFVESRALRLLRANFYWGKDRTNDRRPTVGVTSEVIHALDLVQLIGGHVHPLDIKAVLGSRSDFSISGDNVLDSVSVLGTMGGTVVTGYSSFVNPTRKREVDFTFVAPDGKLVYAATVFDTPSWDVDSLRIWERTPSGERILLDLLTSVDGNPELGTIRKLVRLVDDVLGHATSGAEPSQPFPDLAVALSLQRQLMHIERQAATPEPVRYIAGTREFLNDGDWERLG